MSQTAALDNQFDDADGFYEALLDAHQGTVARQYAAPFQKPPDMGDRCGQIFQPE